MVDAERELVGHEAVDALTTALHRMQQRQKQGAGMRCKKCEERGARHTVTLEDTQRIVGAVARSWDGDNIEHRHDASWEIRYYRCNNGHVFWEPTGIQTCPASGPELTSGGCTWHVGIQGQVDRLVSERRADEARR